MLPAMRIGQDVLSELGSALDREWLITNGIGGSASGTAAGANARRTHALLVAASPQGRLTSMLLKLDERLVLEGAAFELGVSLWAGGLVRPTGHLLLEEFRLDPWPVWRYRAGEVVLEKSIFLIHGRNAVVASYRHLEGPKALIAVSPVVAARDPHALGAERANVRGAAQGVPGRVRIEIADDAPALTLWHNGAFLPARVWQRQLDYPLDRAEGRPADTEDALVPGHVEGNLGPGETLHVVAAIEDDLFRSLAAEERLGTPPPRSLHECVVVLERAERARLAFEREAALEGADFTARQASAAHGAGGARQIEPLVDGSDPWATALSAAVLAGLVRRGHRTTLLAQLPAEEERGSETLRALPALVALRDFDDAREVLRGAVEYLHEGLAAESFDPADGTPRHGDPAASLWLVAAAEVYTRRSEDLDFLRATLYPALEGVMQFYRAGTHGVRVDEDGLLSSGNGDLAVRRADLNVLWYHALVSMAQLARLIGRKESGAFYLAWAHEHQKAFNAALWDEERGCLHRAVGDDGPRGALEPSQLLAISLPPQVLPPDRAERLWALVDRELFTPYGLRDQPGADRVDSSWLGAFHSADLRVHSRSAESQARVRGRLEALREALGPFGARLVPARFSVASADEPPRLPRGDGTVSVLAAAEILRVWVEELDRAESAAPIGR